TQNAGRDEPAGNPPRRPPTADAGRRTFKYMRSIASTSSTTCSRKTSATDRAMLIAGSGRPRVLGPTELRALITRARPCRLDRSPLTPPAPADTPRPSEAEPP